MDPGQQTAAWVLRCILTLVVLGLLVAGIYLGTHGTMTR